MSNQSCTIPCPRWERAIADLRELLEGARKDKVDLQSRLDSALKELDEASPMRKCDRCGKEDRMHRMAFEEGDEVECMSCWERCNAQERSEQETRGKERRAPTKEPVSAGHTRPDGRIDNSGTRTTSFPFVCTDHKFREDVGIPGVKRCHVCDYTVWPSVVERQTPKERTDFQRFVDDEMSGLVADFEKRQVCAASCPPQIPRMGVYGICQLPQGHDGPHDSSVRSE